MAAQALSFCSNFSSTSSSSFQKQNQQNQYLKQNSVSFQQRKRPRPSSSSSSLSISPNSNNFPLFSDTYTNPNPNPNTFNTNPFTPLQLQQNHYNNNNPFLPNQTSFRNPNPNYLFPTDIYGTSTFFDPYSPQTLAPLNQQDQYHNNYNSLDFLLNDAPDPIFDFSSPEDQILLAPFLSEPQCPNALDEFQVPQRGDHIEEEIVNHQYYHDQRKKKPSGGATATVVSPQSIAARERRRKIMERTSELGKLIPGGNKMSTAEMFQAAYKYVKFLRAQVSVLQQLGSSNQEEQLYAKELQVLASPIVQEKLYSEEKCLVTKEFLDRTQAKNQLPQANSV